MRKPHYWRHAGAASAPANVLVFDCETWHDYAALVPGGELQTLRLGVAYAYRLERGRRTRFQRITFKDRHTFWEFLHSRLDKRRPLWVVGHNLGYDWGVVGGWGVVTGEHYGVQKAAVSNQLFYMKGVYKGCGLTLVDTFNYYRTSLAAIGKSLGLAKLGFPKQTDPDDVWETYCDRDVEVTALALDNLIQFVRTEQLGPWQASIAGLAFSAFRARFMRDKVLVHVNPPALRLERAAYCGGIVDTPRVGRVLVSPVHEMDVCSMYPAVCRYPLPTRLKGCTARIGDKVVRKLMKDYSVIADVTVDTNDYPYPVKLKDGTYYPLGTYRCTLAHPELEAAFQRGHVKYIHRAAWYYQAPLLKEYMEFFVGKKTEFRHAGNEAWATVAKYFANNLYGKTGQLTPQWREWGPDAMRLLETRYNLPPDSLSRYDDKPPTLYSLEETMELHGVPEVVHVRDYYNVVEVKVGESESRESCPAIAATVTSYARVLLREYQAIAGPGEWFYSDTDSIWVSDTGRKRLEASGRVGDEVLGYLSCKGTHEWLHVYGPKDYETPTFRRLKGVKASAKSDGKGGWVQLQFPSPLTQIADGADGGVFVRHITKRLKRQLKRCKVTEDGSTRPLRFPTEYPK